ncbi:unnamed protein product [Bemisia tabaci]|uniref:Uncharacterized protein n=1 Tax=Bemisia tabaci TaxID=7038 RepID=A0A9P0F584_BEMTA|nr:unnamed protein product [Bemisia tabaci]
MVFVTLWLEGDELFTSKRLTEITPNKKHGVRILTDVFWNVSRDEELVLWTVWSILLPSIYNQLQSALNCKVEVTNFMSLEDEMLAEDEIGQKSGVDLRLTNAALTQLTSDYSKYDFTPAVESSALCIAVPHSQLVPQCFVVFRTHSPEAIMFFRSFSLATWILILTVVGAFVIVHYVYQLSQYKVHATLYSQAEVDLYESTSALLTVYSYFMCGIPPRVLLGRLFTGKILFIISSFSAILIATILQGGMTKLLLSKVHYPEIDTLEDLEKSNIFIQVLDIATSSTFFSAHEGLKSKLSNTLNYCQISLAVQADYSNTYYDIYSSRTDNHVEAAFLNHGDGSGSLLLCAIQIQNKNNLCNFLQDFSNFIGKKVSCTGNV